MIFRIVAPTVAVCMLAAAHASYAQTVPPDPTITFKVPLNLSQVSSDIAKVAVWCFISSPAITTRDGKLQRQEEIPVSGGQLVTTVTVVITATSLDNPIGKPANYECSLTGFSNSLQRWDAFNATHAVAAFRLSPTPVVLAGNFVW